MSIPAFLDLFGLSLLLAGASAAMGLAGFLWLSGLFAGMAAAAALVRIGDIVKRSV